jgi:NADPH-dependent 2,4-dienoyl-CoA reductase/sulfur reductase-like enzyme
MRILVIGAVAAGTSAAAKARRNNKDAEIVIYERDVDISYSGCGLPYFIGGEIESVKTITPRDPIFFRNKYNVEVKIQHEVQSIDAEAQTLQVKNLKNGRTFQDHYDKLVIATGASAFVPPIKGADQDHVFSLRNVRNAVAIRNYIEKKRPKHAVVAGTGFIGFEVLENLMNRGIKVTIVELADKITPNLDPDMAMILQKLLQEKGIDVRTSTSISSIEGRRVVLSNGLPIDADMVVLATGVRPNTRLAVEAGAELGATKAIKVNKRMETSLDNVYACGDCIETYSSITGKGVYRPLGSTANKTGRIAGDAMTGGDLTYQGNLGTGIFKLFDWAIGSTGLSEREAAQAGYSVVVNHITAPDRPDYFHGEKMVIKAIADRKNGKLLGVQIIGGHGVDKRMDVFATLITYGAKVDELFHLDLAYAPPFSTTKDPVHYTGMIMDSLFRK